MVRYLADAEDFTKVVTSAGGRLIAIDCTASWCGPCQMIGPRFEAMASEAQFEFVDFYKLDVDQNQEVAAQLGVRAMPTFVLFRHGVKIEEFTGADEGKLRLRIAAHGGPPTDIPPGSRVVLMGIASRPELNGRSGAIVGYDAEKVRYTVQLEADGETQPQAISLKRDNLVQAASVKLLRQSPDGSATSLPASIASLAGDISGDLAGYDGESGEYAVKVPASASPTEPMLIPMACCEAAVGMTGVVTGLQGAAEHNGKPARLLSVDAASGRYVVALSASQQLKVKRANFRL